METLRILAVDDDPHLCKVLHGMLETLGYEVDSARDGASALRRAMHRHYDIAVIDYMLPGLNGVEVFQAAREHQPALVGVFLTGYAQLDVVYSAVAAGATRVLAKPLDIVELGELLEEIAEELAMAKEDAAEARALRAVAPSLDGVENLTTATLHVH